MSTVPRVAPGPVDTTHSPHARLRTLPLDAVSLTGGLWADRQAVNATASLRHGHAMLERAGNFRALRMAAGLERGEYPGPLYLDSDVYKWLEAVAWQLGRAPDAELQELMDGAIAQVDAAQTDEGYINSYYQVVEPEHRWANLTTGHELYCAGHLIQAAVAQRRATGAATLMAIARRFADYIDATFGPGQRPGTPGHPEIEMALVELYRETGERRYLDLAGFFLDQRGHGILGKGSFDSAYYCDHVPVREATEITGHAVRALYLAVGVADVYLETGERALFDATLRQWRDLTGGKLYVTGGAGAREHGEAFGAPYELPSEEAYSETCAAIAGVFWNWRLLLATGEGRYADLIEWTLYNAFLGGVSLDGRAFCYVNPLLCRTAVQRADWYRTACCPPNVMRLLASLGHYVATHDARGVQIHQYAPATIEAEPEPGRQVGLEVQTEYPWQGMVAVTVTHTDDEPWQLALRVPAWCTRPALRHNGQPLQAQAGTDRYLAITRPWQEGDKVELDLPLTPALLVSHPRVEATRGSVAITCGPVVYCLEACDQEAGVDVLAAEIDETAPLEAAWRGDLLGGVMVLEGSGYATDLASWENRLYRPLDERDAAPRRPVRLTAVPYFARGNREPGAMRVWVPRAGLA